MATYHILRIPDGGSAEDVDRSAATTTGTDQLDTVMGGRALVVVLDPTRLDGDSRDRALELLEQVRRALLAGDWPVV